MLRIIAFAAAAVFCCDAVQSQEHATNGDVKIRFWQNGPRDGVPLVLINGQGAATRPTGDALVKAFVTKGFHVITFDNRDSGQSTVYGLTPPRVAYDLSEMASDAVAVLDAAGIDQAHFLGHSLGGMIAQMVAIDHPDRAMSIISVSATSCDPNLALGPAATAMFDPATFAGMERAQIQAHAYRLFEGDARYRMTDRELADRVAADMAVTDPGAAERQLAAAIATGDRRRLLADVDLPALIIHGSDDPWFPVLHAESTATALNAKVEIIDGMGHIIADSVAEIVATRAAAFIDELPRR